MVAAARSPPGICAWSSASTPRDARHDPIETDANEILRDAPTGSILRRLGLEVTSLRQRFGVKEIAVFGSLARDELNERSDLDFLVTFEGKPDFDRFMDLKLYLEDIFARPIDLVTKNALRPELRPGIEREAIHVP